VVSHKGAKKAKAQRFSRGGAATQRKIFSKRWGSGKTGQVVMARLSSGSEEPFIPMAVPHTSHCLVAGDDA